MSVLVIDNSSPFTKDIIKSLDFLQQSSICVHYSDLSTISTEIKNSKYVVLSGRRHNNNETNRTNFFIIKQCLNNDIPILGICYGAEIISLFFGGTIRKMANSSSGITSIKIINENSQMNLEKNSIFRVYESHRFEIPRLPSTFETIASSAICINEIFIHTSKKIVGV